MKKNIDSIITEEINRKIMINEDNSVKDLFAKLLKVLKKNKNGKSKKDDDEKPQIRKKKVVGGTQEYDYNEYQRKNTKLSKSDFDKVAKSIDQDLTDIAAVARKVYPDHTDEGGQSQLRKVLNGDRPMTRPVAKKLKTMISRGQIAVK
jgi:hypothetical protein